MLTDAFKKDKYEQTVAEVRGFRYFHPLVREYNRKRGTPASVYASFALASGNFHGLMDKGFHGTFVLSLIHI